MPILLVRNTQSILRLLIANIIVLYSGNIAAKLAVNIDNYSKTDLMITINDIAGTACIYRIFIPYGANQYFYIYDFDNKRYGIYAQYKKMRYDDYTNHYKDHVIVKNSLAIPTSTVTVKITNFGKYHAYAHCINDESMVCQYR